MEKNNNNYKKNKNSLSKDFSNDSNIIKMKTSFNSKNLMHYKKLRVTLIVVILILLLLIVRIGFLQFVQGNYLKELAYNQQTINQIISPKRGNIYDSTGKALAISAQVDTITINPNKLVKNSNEETKEFKEKIAKGLSEIFELNYDEVLENVNSSSQVETIAKKVEQEKVDTLKKWMEDNKISVGINIDEDTKRYYPYNTVASNVIGFCGSDNQGLSGVESKWDSILTGTPGKIVSSKGSNQEEIPNAEETYISAENGSDLTLTIDLNIQTIIEKYLKQAVEDNDCKKGGNVIVMNPKNGDILGMACYPDYNLNSPYTPNSTLAETYDSLSNEEKSESLYKMWSNKSVAETYEPGSVFKVITASVALEENITTTDKSNDFYCKGYEEFEDSSASQPLKISCWRANPHGVQSLRQALCNSCNPAFMQLGKRIGAPTLYKYYEAFGLFDSTNSGLYGEQSSIFQKLDKVGPVELATMSFGQRLNVTPLQMATAIACVANDGVLMKPRIVKQVTNTDSGSVSEIPVTQVRQVISKETAQEVKSMMESVVTIGTGKHAAVSGYSIGGKTGTSEPVYNKTEEGYVASYVAISPVEDTQVVLLLTLYDPPKSNHQGGQLAGPVVSQMLSEILPYLGIPSNENSSDSSSSDNLIVVPDVRNKTVSEAEKILKNSGFSTKTYVNGDANNTLVVDQTPKPGVSLSKNSVVVLYGEGNDVATSVTVPDLKGMNASQASNTLKEKNLNISIEGSGTVISQDAAKDEKVPEGTVIKVTLKQNLTDAH
ncbi:penicillin-binding protein transpeptidase [Clostridium sp. CAG:343]|jgi:stage V sporulation protein D (sporulation-specific penicillin-binding protein)|nr:penicillin-binding protein transpeptidase [Clostridium sp. CAG:343]HCF35170.1 PASTA domain-containing protein [Clostridiales bacterium]